MQTLKALFPPDEFYLLAVILGLPALGAFINGVFGKRLGKDAVRFMALFALGGAFLASIVAFVLLRSYVGDGREHVTWLAWHWLDLSIENGLRSTPVQVEFFLDPLN